MVEHLKYLGVGMGIISSVWILGWLFVLTCETKYGGLILCLTMILSLSWLIGRIILNG